MSGQTIRAVIHNIPAEDDVDLILSWDAKPSQDQLRTLHPDDQLDAVRDFFDQVKGDALNWFDNRDGFTVDHLTGTPQAIVGASKETWEKALDDEHSPLHRTDIRFFPDGPVFSS